MACYLSRDFDDDDRDECQLAHSLLGFVSFFFRLFLLLFRSITKLFRSVSVARQVYEKFWIFFLFAAAVGIVVA